VRYDTAMQRLCLILVVGLLFQGCRRSDEVAVPVSSEIRIVSLAPSITEAVCAVGAGHLLVGRTSACNYPPDELANVPIIGGFGVPSLELLAKARPTLVLETALADESIGAQLDAMGLERKRIRCHSLDDIPTMLRTIGVLTGCEINAEVLASELTKELHRLKALPRNADSPKVYAEIWHDPMTTIGKRTFLSDLIALAGGQSVGDDAGKDYYQISPEHVISTNPDVVLCLYMGKNEGASDAVKNRPGWQHINAVRHDAVYDSLSNDILLRPGPRVLEGVAQLKACFSGKSK
jgi:iron complex transport system substrate-binding protein